VCQPLTTYTVLWISLAAEISNLLNRGNAPAHLVSHVTQYFVNSLHNLTACGGLNPDGLRPTSVKEASMPVLRTPAEQIISRETSRNALTKDIKLRQNWSTFSSRNQRRAESKHIAIWVTSSPVSTPKELIVLTPEDVTVALDRSAETSVMVILSNLAHCHLRSPYIEATMWLISIFFTIEANDDIGY
jgi:hypothetical protein